LFSLNHLQWSALSDLIQRQAICDVTP
jgi:hypothetical protein